MRKLMLSSAMLCLIASSQTARPQTPKALAVMPPNGFKFEGSWACEGAFRGAKVHKAAFTAATILNGSWLELTERDVEPATGYQAKYLIGYDPQQKQLIEFDANNFGAATYTSPDGWQNNILTMTSAVSTDTKAPYAANRFIYSIAGPNAFKIDWQISRAPALNWVTSDHLLCQR